MLEVAARRRRLGSVVQGYEDPTQYICSLEEAA